MAGVRLGNNKKTWMVYFRWDDRKCEFSTDLKDEDGARAKAREVEEFRKLVLHKSIPIPENVVDVPRWIVTGGREGFKQNGSNGRSGTIDELVARYLDARKLRLGSKTKPLSQASYREDVRLLNAFKAFCQGKGKSKLAVALSSEVLGQYRDSLITSTEGPFSVRHKLRAVKALLLWAYDEELIDNLPRCVKKYNDITLPDPKPRFFTIKQVQTLYNNASPRLKLWILLGLNCGFTQTDISSLTPDMVDWESGIIARDRQKTGVDSQHKLWPLTLKMLREQAGSGPLLLTTRGGQPLLQERIKEDGNPSKTDMIGRAFASLKEEVGMTLPFKHFRKTGANAIAKHFQDKPWLVELYLAHRDPRMRKHYTQQHYDELHKAIEWLSDHFGLEPTARN